MYLLSIFTNLLHFLPGELAHHIALKSLKALHFFGLTKVLVKTRNIHTALNDKDIRKLHSKVGIAAGLDKNGDYIDCLAALGISFIEVGTVTPRPQSGNPKPRVFRNLKEKSLLNRLGFNNKGVDYAINKIVKSNYKGVIGLNIGKNSNTTIDRACDDYVYCLKKAHKFVDYITV